MTFYQVKCVFGWVHNYLSVTINERVDDPIENINFDRYFDKYIIVDSFRKVECVSFTHNCLSNPKVRHQVDEASSDDVKLQVLQEDHVVTFKKRYSFNI